MLRIFKKCEKSVNNPYGSKEIKNLDTYDQPFLLCISAQDKNDKSVFGIIKEGARAARVRTSDELAGGFKIDEMGLDFLGLKYDYSNIKDKKSNSLVDDFLYPFLKRGKDIRKQARKINILTYCNATNVYIQAENRLRERLLEDGYSELEVIDILSQIGVISIASSIDLSKVYATNITFKDVNDMDAYDRYSRKASKWMEENISNTYVGKTNIYNNSILFATNGPGDHELKIYLRDGNPLKNTICSAVTFLVENSILNSKVDELIPLTGKHLLKRVVTCTPDKKEILDSIDMHLNYYASRYTKEEHELLSKIDKICKKLIATQKYLESETNELQSEREKNNTLIKGIKEKCSEVAFEQIVAANGIMSSSKGKSKLRELPTDRQVREAYDSLIEEKGITRKL